MSPRYGMGDVPDDARDLLKRFQISATEITLAIPYLWQTPGSSDMSTAGVQVIVKALQRGLKYVGLYTKGIDGILGVGTMSALDKVLPPKGTWRSTPWVNLVQAVFEQVKKKKMAEEAAPAKKAQSAYAPQKLSEEIAPPPPEPPPGLLARLMRKPVVVAGGAFVILYLLFGRKRRS